MVITLSVSGEKERIDFWLFIRNMSKKCKKYVLVEIKCDIIRKMICPVSTMLRQGINCNTNL